MSNLRSDWIIATLLEELSDIALATEQVSLGRLIDTLGSRGFGPLLVILSAFLILPVGMVPGMPGIVGVFLILIGSRMAVGSTHLWFPSRLRKVELPSHLLIASISRAQPWVLRLRPMIAPRATILIDSPVMLKIIAVILIVTGAINILIGFIPGLPFLMSMHVLLIGIGLSSRDGLIGLLGYLVVLPEMILIWRLLL
ncbi:hypothetical protein C8N32_101214 [Rhodovulum imhoffii]|uniref:Exopolysaccharide synthesis protein ExoD n=1 Tax=Rhodovulum imhoffii TaxID=365340 RepID=A0A2T5BWJ3_9RHOB|nr:exopolysaccharide biosynthesis protein [Rhodovulum imhoffii]PTN04017.1 hypothetical protein C8N32_101214 [Rhodovulum imhoffii]